MAKKQESAASAPTPKKTARRFDASGRSAEPKPTARRITTGGGGPITTADLSAAEAE